jgi:type II secretory pathway predicted ATPase ExeA
MRSEAQKKAEKRIQELTKRVTIRFRLDNEDDLELLDYLRHLAEKDCDIPQVIKNLIKSQI